MIKTVWDDDDRSLKGYQSCVPYEAPFDLGEELKNFWQDCKDRLYCVEEDEDLWYDSDLDYEISDVEDQFLASNYCCTDMTRTPSFLSIISEEEDFSDFEDSEEEFYSDTESPNITRSKFFDT